MFSYFAIISKCGKCGEEARRVSELIQTVFTDYVESVNNNNMIFLEIKNRKESGIRTFYLKEGAIVGTVFKKNPHFEGVGNIESISHDDMEKIASSEGRHLISEFWGRYVAFIISKSNKGVVVVRDPTGAIPAYYIEIEDLIIFFSDSERMAKLNLFLFEFNIEHIGSHIKMPVIDYADTGIRQIKKVLRGEAVKIENGRIESYVYWSPRKFIRKNKFWDKSNASEALNKAISFCVNTWSNEFDKKVVLLSGGLDSSILLSCLSKDDVEKRTVALNYYSSGVDEDERKWAKLMANYSGATLEFKKNTVDEVDISVVNNFIVHAEPVPCYALMVIGQHERTFADKHHADATFLGEGGDIIFYSGSKACPGDYLWNHGLTLGLLRQCAHDALASNISFSRSFINAVKEIIRPSKFDMSEFLPEKEYSVLSSVVSSSIDMNDRCKHWLEELNDVSYAKSLHVMTTRFIDFYIWPNSMGNIHPRIQPLLSQPILELVYDIPTYLFALNGVDRGLARYSFRNQIPEEIMRRQSKGGVDEFHRGLYIKHNKFLREYFIDGMLVKYGIIDSNKIEKALDVNSSADSYFQNVIMSIVGLEAWMRRWRDISG